MPLELQLNLTSRQLNSPESPTGKPAALLSVIDIGHLKLQHSRGRNMKMASLQPAARRRRKFAGQYKQIQIGPRTMAASASASGYARAGIDKLSPPFYKSFLIFDMPPSLFPAINRRQQLTHELSRLALVG